MADFFNLSTVICDVNAAIRARGLESSGDVQRYIDTQVLELCNPKVPFDNGKLAESGDKETTIGSGEVKYHTPYARRWYYMPAIFQGAPERGNYWFERMKHEGGRDQILRGAKRISGAK